MKRLKTLRKTVESTYLQKHPDRSAWADWLYPNHVVWVADKTEELCAKYGGDPEIAIAAALLHDIADATTERNDKNHEEKSKDIARNLCTEAGYNDEEITIIVDDILEYHSCRGDDRPSSLEGKIVSTADSLSHFYTDFYLYAFAQGSSFGDYEWQVSWMNRHLDKDFNNKIFFKEIKQEVRPTYEALKRIAVL